MPKPFPDIAITTIANNTPTMNKAMLEIYKNLDNEIERLDFIDFLVSDRHVVVCKLDHFFMEIQSNYYIKAADSALYLSFLDTVGDAKKFCFDNNFTIVGWIEE